MRDILRCITGVILYWSPFLDSTRRDKTVAPGCIDAAARSLGGPGTAGRSTATTSSRFPLAAVGILGGSSHLRQRRRLNGHRPLAAGVIAIPPIMPRPPLCPPLPPARTVGSSWGHPDLPPCREVVRVLPVPFCSGYSRQVISTSARSRCVGKGCLVGTL
jgi:hypothetical protein